MALASHLGPWLLGTVKNTTGTTAGLIRNMGSTNVSQTATYTAPTGISTAAPYTGTATTVAVVPAGSYINTIILDVTTAFVGATGATTLTIKTGNATTGLSTNLASGSTLASVSGTSTLSAGRQTVSFDTTNIGYLGNVGTSDLILTLTFATAGNYTSGGSVNVVIAYTVRNADGTSSPTYSQA